MTDHEIFVSYAWRGESEALVDKLCETFAARGYTITRDKSAMTYRDSIKEFMNRIGRGKFIVAVVNDKYMKSEYCMYEAYRMFQSPEFRQRIFPIVLPDADIFSFRGQANYLEHWVVEYKALEKEYRDVAEHSPTMAAPLTERLRDIEVTTRFINDFMAAVADMNVLTHQMHLDSNFSQLISAIEARMAEAEETSKPAQERAEPKKETRMTDENKVNTGGGAYVGGNVNTGGGDFVGRDKISYGNEYRGVGAQEIAAAFAKLQQALETVPDSPKKMMATQALKGLEEEAQKGDEASEENTQQWFDSLIAMLPDIGEVALDTFINPIKGLSTVFQKVAKHAKEQKSNRSS